MALVMINEHMEFLWGCNIFLEYFVMQLLIIIKLDKYESQDNLPKLSNILSKTGLHDSESSATIQNNRLTCISVCPSRVNSAICSRLRPI